MGDEAREARQCFKSGGLHGLVTAEQCDEKNCPQKNEQDKIVFN